MILTITLNPSVDINYKLEHFSLDNVNRVANVSKTAGGKGLNVSHVLSQLGEEVGASGFLGGSLGDFIRKEISKIGIHDFFIDIQGETRNCIAIIHDGHQTEILENGPTVVEEEATLFLKSFTESVQEFGIITISGSLPKGVNEDFYIRLLEIAHSTEKPVLLDTKGSLLETTLTSTEKPYLIKPNQQELGDLLGRKISEERDIITALQEEIFHGIEWIVVTLGANGAIVKNKNRLYRAKIPKVHAVNPVGSGDSVIAGFAAGLSRGYEGEKLIQFGLAMGTLNALEEKTGSIDIDKVDECIEAISIAQIEFI